MSNGEQFNTHPKKEFRPASLHYKSIFKAGLFHSFYQPQTWPCLMSRVLELCGEDLVTENPAGGKERPGFDVSSHKEWDTSCNTDPPLSDLVKKVLATGK